MDPVAFHVFGRPIYWYGVMVALGFLAGITHWTRIAKREGWPPQYGSDIGLWIMIGGIVGARVAYVIANWSEYAAAPWTIFRFDQGGLVYYGGFIGATLAVVLFARRRGKPVLTMGDYAIGGLPLGHAIGRIGCFINGCCFGSETTCPVHATLDGVNRHPVQLYESVVNVVIYVLLLHAWPRRQRDGRILAVYLLLYPATRFLLEFLRGDVRLHGLGLTVAQLLSLALFAIGMALWFTAPKRMYERANHCRG
jgi:phosphatidylglycerol:prolipoprotein diacylglycerol transferase